MTGAEIFIFASLRELDICRDLEAAQRYLEPWQLEEIELVVSAAGVVYSPRAERKRVVLDEAESAPAGIESLRQALSDWLNGGSPDDDIPTSALVDTTIERVGFS